MVSKSYHGFTLVELIVVVTVLSILATLAFFSFSQRSADARDTLRKSDVSMLAKTIGNRIYVDSQSLSSSVGSSSANHLFSTGSVSYNTGNPNPRVFGNDKFFDPLSGDPYIIGYVQGSFGSYYQVGATLESNTAIIEGIYFKENTDDLGGIIKDPNGSNPIVNGGSIVPY